MGTTFDPYEEWLGIRSRERDLSHYQLLGLPAFESDRSLIDQAARRQLARIKTLATAERAAVATLIAHEIVAAHNILLSPAKQAYDHHLHAVMANPSALRDPAEHPPAVDLSSPSPPKRSTWRRPVIAASAIAALAVVAVVVVVLCAALEVEQRSSATVAQSPRPQVSAPPIATKEVAAGDAGRPHAEIGSPASIEPIGKSKTQKVQLMAAIASPRLAPKPVENLSVDTGEVTLTGGAVVKLETYPTTYQGYDWRPPINLYSYELHTVLDSAKIRGFNGVVSLTFDPAHDKMYWATYAYLHRLGRIQRANLDGRYVENLVTDLYEPRGLAVDFARRRMFFTEEVWGVPGTQSSVKAADLNGRDVRTIVRGAIGPGPIALDPETGDIFFYESPVHQRHLNRIRPDGNGETPIVLKHVINNIIVDRPAGKLYWTSRDKRIWRANLDGSQIEIVVDVGGGEMASFSFDPQERKFYWVDQASQQLCRSNMDGTQVELLVIRPPITENPQNRGIGSVAVLRRGQEGEPIEKNSAASSRKKPDSGHEPDWLYVGGVYFKGIDPYAITYRMAIPPLLQPVPKPAPPKITSVTPAKLSAGGEVEVAGTGFKGAKKVALFDDGAGGEVAVEYDVISDTKLSFRMPELSESCRHAAVIVLTPGGVTVTLPISLSVARPNIFRALPTLLEMNTKKIYAEYGNIWYVIGQHQKIRFGSQQTQTGLGRVNSSLVYVEPQGSASTGERGHNVMFLKDGAVSGARQWRSVVYHEPFAIINNDYRESSQQMDAKFVPVPAIRPSFLPQLLEYEQKRR